jgi:hypothetical protein
MRKKFVLPIKGLSINSTYYGDKRHGFTPEAQNWFSTVLHLLGKSENAAGLKQLRDAFNPLKHAYAFQIKAFIPKNIYYTKEGKLSRRAFDISNFEKALLDVFCLDKYQINLLTDDCVVRSCHSIKLPADDWSIEVTIRIVKN